MSEAALYMYTSLRKEGRKRFLWTVRLFTEKIQNNLQKSGTRKTAQVSGFKMQ